MSGRKVTSEEMDLWLNTMSGVVRIEPVPVKPTTLPERFVAPRFDIWSPVIDLHGVTIQEAYARVQLHINEAIRYKWRRLTIITGKSGSINQEFRYWLEHRREILKVSQKNGGGAWEIWLKKNTSTQTS